MKLPNIMYCVLCEGVRPEQGGKATVLGFLGVLPHVQMTIEDDGEPLERGVTLMFLLATQGGEGAMKFQAALLDPNGSVLKTAPEKIVEFQPGQQRNIGILLPSIVFQNTGVYTYQLLIDGKEHYRNSFNVTAIAKSLLVPGQLATQ